MGELEMDSRPFPAPLPHSNPVPFPPPPDSRLRPIEMIPQLLVFVPVFWLSIRSYFKGLFRKPLYTIVRYADVIFPKSVHISGAKLLFFLTQRWLPENQIINLSSFMFFPLITTPTSLFILLFKSSQTNLLVVFLLLWNNSPMYKPRIMLKPQ